MLRPRLGDARSLAHGRTAAISADQISPTKPAGVAAIAGDKCHAFFVLLDCFTRPTIFDRDIVQAGGARPEHCLCLVLRNTLVPAPVEIADPATVEPVMHMVRQERPVRRHAADSRIGR